MIISLLIVISLLINCDLQAARTGFFQATSCGFSKTADGGSEYSRSSERGWWEAYPNREPRNCLRLLLIGLDLSALLSGLVLGILSRIT